MKQESMSDGAPRIVAAIEVGATGDEEIDADVQALGSKMTLRPENPQTSSLLARAVEGAKELGYDIAGRLAVIGGVAALAAVTLLTKEEGPDLAAKAKAEHDAAMRRGAEAAIANLQRQIDAISRALPSTDRTDALADRERRIAELKLQHGID